MDKPNLGILIKPASYDCNLACDYCYYRPVEALYGDVKRPRLSPDIFDTVLEQYLALGPREVKIGWQGGEPTLMGLDFFKKAVEIESRHARPGDCFGNSIQTNGIVLDDEWCRFLAANHFLVGLSIDGPEHMNTMRHFRDGRPVFERTMRAIELMKEHGVEFNILVVISRANVDHPREVFQFLVENDLHYSQFIPCTEPGDGAGRTSEHSITAAEYGRFITTVFDAWVEHDDPSYYVRRIDNWLHQFFGLPPECCEYREDCSNLITIEWNGDVYPCDFFVEERYRMGNVREMTIAQMLRGDAFRSFVSGAESLPPVCRDCELLKYCRGGCFRHRQKLGIGNDEVPYLCEAKKMIFPHVFSRLHELQERGTKPGLHAFLNRVGNDVATGRTQPQASPDVAPGRRPPPSRAPAPRGSVSRNAPCPCGSGKKFKHCCGSKARAAPSR